MVHLSPTLDQYDLLIYFIGKVTPLDSYLAEVPLQVPPSATPVFIAPVGRS